MLSLKIILATLLIVEGVTLFLRFGLDKESKNFHINRMSRKWKKTRIHWHHFLLGLLIIPASLIFTGLLEEGLFNLGLGIFLSDFIHHFLILTLITGKSEFYLLYKNKDLYEEKNCLTKRRKMIRKFTKLV